VRHDHLTVLYDGYCSACRAGVQRLRALDPDARRVTLVDFRADETLAARHNLHPADVRREMHAITDTETVLTGMDAVRATLTAVNRGWALSWTKLPLIRQLADAAYRLFARHRLTLFGTKRVPDA